jgi:outer membrane protein, multidrug efflux system
LFTAGSRMGGIGPALHLPIFARGQLHAAYGASQAQLEAAAAQYDASVVDAARDVATQALTLAQVGARREERVRQLDATLALQRSAIARVRRGLGDDRNLLAAQVDVLQQRDAAIALHAQAIAAEIALTKALGGGYRLNDVRSGQNDIDDPGATRDDATRLKALPANQQRADSR